MITMLYIDYTPNMLFTGQLIGSWWVSTLKTSWRE